MKAPALLAMLLVSSVGEASASFRSQLARKEISSPPNAITLLGLGVACTSGNQCLSGHCIGSVCTDYFTSTLTSNPGTQCDGTAITLSGGETLTYTRASNGYCTDSTGAMTLRSSNESRVSNSGVLIEGARTNSLLRSEELDHASWSGTATVTADQAAPPWSGSNLMDNVATVASNNRYQCPTGISATTSFASSGYGRTASGTGNGGLTSYCLASTLNTCDAYTESATATGSGGASQCVGVIPLTTTVIKGSTVSACTASKTSSCVEVMGINSGTGDKHWAGIMLEGGAAFSSSYIPTTTTAATRALDDIHFTPSVAISSAGCVSGTVTTGPVPAVGGRLIGGAAATGIYIEDVDSVTISDGTNTVTVDPGVNGGNPAWDHMSRVSYAFKATWTGTTMTLEVNGVSGSGTFDGNMDMGTVYLGSQAATSNFLFGYLDNLKFGSSAGGCL